ncbi:VOC family protein [Rhodovibrio salinarum]|uniref:VOC family protein n=1 Tax=Rhodovibrio salinarum TaxID=1087 RepID=A0A934QKX8_9PROT|nr:VOC family protein [Rhodovibrio salinarum]
MDQRISVVTLGVRDLARARTFYEALGWRVATEDGAERIVAFQLPGMALVLYPRAELEADAGVEMSGNGHPPITLAINMDTPEAVDAALARATTAGGVLVKPGQKVFWGGYSGYFSDPDGVLWEVAHNPFATLGPDGAFTWH